jgi:signal transduction histidine kinase/ligand-binding sensor domain-containing protein
MQKYAAYAAAGISGIAQAFDGSIVWTDASNGLQWFVNGKIMRYPAGLRAAAHPRILLSDHEGSLWIGTMGQALMHVHQGRTDQYTRADGLSGDTVFGFFEDHERNVWVATERGLDRFRDFPVVTFSKREGLSEDIAGSVFAAGSGGVWIGTTNGLNLVQDGRISVYEKHQGLTSNSIGSLFEDHTGTLWVDSALGLAYGRAGRFRQLGSTQDQKITSVAAIVEDAKGDLWVSDLKRGIIRIGGSQVKDVLPWSFFEHKKASALDVDRTHGGLLIGFEEGGVALYQEGRPIRWYTVAEGLGHGEITDIQTDRSGATWIATEGGLSCLRDGKISTLSTKSGLPCDHIHAIIEDDEGTIWLNSACGLLRLLRQDLLAWLHNPRVDVSPRMYDSADGMHVRSTTDGYFRRAAKSKDGRLWFPVFDGVAVVDPRHLPHNSIPPPVTIERVVADGKTYSAQSEVRLPAGTKGWRIDYTAFSFVDPNRVRFRYKLEGYDAGWNDVNGRRQAFFSNLAPRHYRLRVMASNNDGIWNEVGATLDFFIQPAFYQTNWFRLSCIAAFFVLLWLLYRLRLQQVEAKLNLLFNERLNERARIARDLHDTLLQNISGFALQLEGLSKIVTEPAAAKEWLRELRRAAEGWLHDARESVSDLRSQNSESDDLLADVRDLGERIVTSKSIKFRATATGDHWMIPSRLHDPLLRIVQEALRNAVRHACATEINVDLSCLNRDNVRIRICDNGCGFDLETAIRKPRHWGLANMREHAESTGATFRVVTSPGRGTEVEITARISS